MAATLEDRTGNRRWTRRGAKTVHDLASIGFGGGLAACLVINHLADGASPATFAPLRQAFAAIAQYVLIPSVAVVVVSGLFALAATRGYIGAGWAWLKALLGLSVLEATLLVVGSSSNQAELAAAASDPTRLASLLNAERNTLWVLVALSVVNVVLAVWRPRLTPKSRQPKQA